MFTCLVVKDTGQVRGQVRGHGQGQSTSPWPAAVGTQFWDENPVSYSMGGTSCFILYLT